MAPSPSWAMNPRLLSNKWEAKMNTKRSGSRTGKGLGNEFPLPACRTSKLLNSCRHDKLNQITMCQPEPADY